MLREDAAGLPTRRCARVPQACRFGVYAVGPLVTSSVYVYASSGAADHYNRFLVGTVWKDTDGNGFYDPGEEFDGVTVRPAHGSFFAVTSKSGGDSIPILGVAPMT